MWTVGWPCLPRQAPPRSQRPGFAPCCCRPASGGGGPGRVRSPGTKHHFVNQIFLKSRQHLKPIWSRGMFTHTPPTHFSGPNTVPSKSFYPGLSSFAPRKWLNRIPLFLAGGQLGVVCLFSRLARLYGNRRLYLSQRAVCTGGKHSTECTILRVPGQPPPVPGPKCQISVHAVSSIVGGCLSPVPLLFQTWFLWGGRW